jgi:2-dehydro-3-deoxyphosphogluconate aldolase/(4S)-4-hydroxy-2-oxoglutarate aldolase
MANFSNDTIQQAMKSSGMIPVFFHADIEVAKAVVDAAYKGGVRVFEFTNRGENAFQVFSELLKHVQKYPDLMLGIGTIMDAATTQKFISAGAHFIVSPILKQEMAAVCHKENKLWIPGCATLTEIVTAKDLGAKVIKIFPRLCSRPWLCVFDNASSTRVATHAHWWRGANRSQSFRVVQSRSNLCWNGITTFTKEVIETKNWAKLEQSVADALAIIVKIRKK